MDHNISDKISIFGRYNYAPSEDQQRARFCAASCVADLTYKTETLTVGSIQIFSSKLTNDLRVNFSKSKVNQTYFIDNFGGAIVPPHRVFTRRSQPRTTVILSLKSTLPARIRLATAFSMRIANVNSTSSIRLLTPSADTQLNSALIIGGSRPYPTAAVINDCLSPTASRISPQTASDSATSSHRMSF
jgi:hypothetical protein